MDACCLLCAAIRPRGGWLVYNGYTILQLSLETHRIADVLDLAIPYETGATTQPHKQNILPRKYTWSRFLLV